MQRPVPFSSPLSLGVTGNALVGARCFDDGEQIAAVSGSDRFHADVSRTILGKPAVAVAFHHEGGFVFQGPIVFQPSQQSDGSVRRSHAAAGIDVGRQDEPDVVRIHLFAFQPHHVEQDAQTSALSRIDDPQTVLNEAAIFI